jgi:serine/threonine-protein kinase
LTRSGAADNVAVGFMITLQQALARRRGRWIGASLVLLIGAARFVGSGLLPAMRGLNGDFAAVFPNATIAAHLRPDFPTERVWPGFNYGPMFHVVTLPLFAVPRFWMVPIVWAICNLIFLAISFVLILRLSGAGRKVTPAALVVLAGLWLFFQPLVNCFTQGNIEIVELLFILASLALLQRGRQYTAGTLMGAAAMIKLLPVGFLGWFAIRRQWRALSTGVAAFVVILGFAIASGAYGENLARFGGWIANTPFAGLHELSITSLYAHRAAMIDYGNSSAQWLPSERYLAGTRAGTAATALLAAVFGVVLIAKSRTRVSAFELGILFIAMLMLPQWNHDYYYVFALVPFSIVFLRAAVDRQRGVIAALLLAYMLMSPLPFGVVDRAHVLPVSFAYLWNFYNLPVVGALLLWMTTARQLLAEPGESWMPRLSLGWRYVAAGSALLVVIAGAAFAMSNRVQAKGAASASTAALTFDPPLASAGPPAIALSPDATRVAYAATSSRNGTQLCTQLLSDKSTRCLADTDDASAPFFSPDGRWIGFLARDAIKKVAVGGGAPVTIAKAPGADSASWATGGTIVFASTAGISRVAASGGEPTLLAAPPDGGTRYRWPTTLPRTDTILFSMLSPLSDGGTGTIMAWSPKSAAPTQVVVGTQPHVDEPCGCLSYAIGGRVVAARFDRSRLEVTAVGIPLAPPVLTATDGGAQFAVASGSLVYMPSAGNAPAVRRRLVWVDRHGARTAMPSLPNPFESPRLSPDDGAVAVTLRDAATDVFVYGAATATGRRVTFTSRWNDTAVWRPGPGRVLAFVTPGAANSSIMITSLDDAMNPSGLRRLWTAPGVVRLGAWSPDGQWLTGTAEGSLWILRVPTEGAVIPGSGQADLPTKTPEVFVFRTVRRDSQPVISPDGRWIAYTSNATGRDEIFVRPLAALGDPIRVSNGGGREPVWSPRGGELFYRNRDAMLTVDVTTGATFRAGAAKPLFTGAFEAGRESAGYDVTRGADRFLMVAPPDSFPRNANVVSGWPGSLPW